MEINKRTLEISLAVIFVALLLLVSILVVSNDKKEDEKVSAQTINMYNIYGDYNVVYNIVNSPNPYYTDSFYEKEEVYEKEYSYYKTQRTREEFLGNYVQELYVYVLNKDSKGKYFTVIFEIEDEWGREYKEIITQYVKSGETKKFEYQHVQTEGDKIVDWDYRIIPRN